MRILHIGTGELLKGGVHAFLGGVLSIVAAFNVAAWVERRDRHLAVNAIGYTLAVGWEIYQTWQHFREEPSARFVEITQHGDKKRQFMRGSY